MKKTIKCILIILYNIISLFLCYVLVKQLIYNFSYIEVEKNGLDIIGGADVPTLIFIAGNIFGWINYLTFLLLSLVTVALLTFSIIKKTNRKLRILICILLVLSLITFLLIPTQTYVISLYTIISNIPFFYYVPYIPNTYIFFSVIIIFINILFLIEKTNKEVEK